MVRVLAEREFEGAIAKVYLWQDFPDGKSEAESNFYKGYLEVYLFGTGSVPPISKLGWKMFYVWPREQFTTGYQGDHALVMIDETCQFLDLEVGVAKLRTYDDALGHPVVTIDFELPDGDIIKKCVMLKEDGTTIEIPDETLQ